MKIVEGYMPYLGYQTYYRIAGECTGNKKPLLCLHGGPGSTHNYFEVLDKLAKEDGRMVISYDQIGCGLSYLSGHPELWTEETWMNELAALREHLKLEEMHLLGQSWGGMMVLEYTCDYHPNGLSSIILSSACPSARLWGEEQHRMIRFMSAEMQAAIAKAEADHNFKDPAFLSANDEFMLRHCGEAAADDAPDCLKRERRIGVEAYETAWGPSEFEPLGNLKDFEYRGKMCHIKEPALVISGIDDLCTPLIAKTMYDEIPNSRWELFTGSRHACFVEENDKYIELLKEWLNKHD